MAYKGYITQKALADRLGVSVQVVHNWVQRGKIKTKYLDDIKITLVQDTQTKPTTTKQPV
jgi:predicted site-specific integrase-resolvase